MKKTMNKIRRANRLLKEAIRELEAEVADECARPFDPAAEAAKAAKAERNPETVFSQQTAAVYGMTLGELFAAWQRAMKA